MPGTYQAVILDLDGVITQTASLHAQAWQQMFNDYLKQQSEQAADDYKPFDIEADYRRYVDGKPRYDGVRSFLESRGLELPQGQPGDDPDQETICGLGNRKNAIFLDLMQQQGVDVYEDTVEQIHHWRKQGLKTAVVSSSRNCVTVLETAGLLDLFDTKVDGVDSDKLGLDGKPAPDIFLQADQQLEVNPQQAVAIEDAIAGVQAGRAGKFGLVVGVAREGDGADLKQHGADRVVHRLDELRLESDELDTSNSNQTASALAEFDALIEQLEGSTVALFTDYDGTLTPIVPQPAGAVLSDEMRSLLQNLAQHCRVAIISGRDLPDVQQMVGLENLYYAGSHGFDIAGPDLKMQQEDAVASLPNLDAAEHWLQEQFSDLPGIRVERKRFAIALHYRDASADTVQRLESALETVLSDYPKLRQSSGKQIFELQPDVQWDKGRAILWLLKQLDLNQPDVLPIYLGDDTTDEDGFRAMCDRGIGIRVGADGEATQATYVLADPDAVQQFCQALLQSLQQASHHG
ncbi:MAG: trehalose-phosphatase [Thainema sp.]